MKVLAMIICAAALFVSCDSKKKDNNDNAAPAATTPKPDEGLSANPPAPKMDSATQNKNMMNYGIPGEMHKMLATWDGTWNAEVKHWPAPGAPPMTMAVKTVNKMVNNGLVQYATHTGNAGGMPFNGVSQTGYDNHRGVFWSTWMDNMSSGLVYMEGTWDEAAKSLNIKGKMTDPGTKQQIDIREVLKIVDDNKQVLEQYYSPEGKEVKAMEITFTRAK